MRSTAASSSFRRATTTCAKGLRGPSAGSSKAPKLKLLDHGAGARPAQDGLRRPKSGPASGRGTHDRPQPCRRRASAIALLSLSNPAPAQMAEVMKYCKGDAERLCPGVQPGGGRIIKCLKAHEM